MHSYTNSHTYIYRSHTSTMVYTYDCRTKLNRLKCLFGIFKVHILSCLGVVYVFLLVKSKFPHAYTQDFPYRIQHILECEFYLLEAMVRSILFENYELFNAYIFRL